MKLESFRELLIKKSGDPSLENLITFVREDVLADLVIESLEKMARSKHKGDSAGVPVKDFGVEMDPETEPNMIHDALSHHASHYKAAVGTGNQPLANQHANQMFRIMDMADQAQKHSNGKLQVEAVSPHPWERTGKAHRLTEKDKPVVNGNKKAGTFVSDTKGWRYRDHGKPGKGFEFLQTAPHEHYSNEVRKHGHNKAYPIEEMKVNGKYIDVKDIPKEDLKGYQEHPFDKHPIMSHFEKPAGGRTPEEDQAWRAEHAAYATSPHMDKYFENLDTTEGRGSKKSNPVHADVPGLEHKKSEEAAEEQKAAPAQESAKPGIIRKPASNPDGTLEERIKKINDTKLPDSIKASMIRTEQKRG